MQLTREQAAASALGSVRAEGGEPSVEVEALLTAWACGEIPTETLTEARRLLAAGQGFDHLLQSTHA